MKNLFRVVSVLFVIALAISTVGSASANNTWAVGNLVGLCAGTHIYQGPGGGYPYHTIVPEDNWIVKVIDGPRYFDGQPWWDTSRFAAGDPSGGTGWVKQSEADGCLYGGGPGGGGGGDGGGGTIDHKYGNTHAGDVISTAATIPGAPELASDGFQWPFSQDRNAGRNATGFDFKAVDTYCNGTTDGRHAAVDYNAGDGEPIYAIGKGKVLYVNWEGDVENRGYGLYIVIWHIAPNGDNVYSLYAHLADGTALVKVGQPVNRGDKIARQDTTGGANHVSHLHFEIRKSPFKFDVTACPYKADDVKAIDNHFWNPITYIGDDYWWEKYSSGQPPSPSPETLKQDVSNLANMLGTQTYLEQGTINQGQTSSQKPFWVGAYDLFVMIYHKIFGSATEIAIYKPDGSLYGTYLVDGPNSYEIVIPHPEPGQWSYTIRGIDIPYENYPYALSVGARTTPFLDLNDNLGENPFGSIEGDLTPPVTTLAMAPLMPDGNNGWFKTPVTLSLYAEDNPGGVGVSEIRYVLNNNHVYVKYEYPFVLSTEGQNDLGYYSTDNMGNAEVLQHAQIKIDLTPPVVSVATDQQEYTRVQPFTAHYSGYDPQPGSGIASLIALFNNQPVIDGQVVDLFWFPLGTYTLTATGQDNAGWVTTNSKTITLIATIPSLQQAVKRLCAENYITKQGTCTSLSQKLASALSAQQRGQNKTAVNILLAFQNELSAQKGKAVTLKAYDLLMMDSNYVIQVLGGK